jgi:hypothetical protein
MAVPDELEIREAIRRERQLLASSLQELRDELGEATDLAGRLGRRLPLAAAGALAAGFVLAGGLGAGARYALGRLRRR